MAANRAVKRACEIAGIEKDLSPHSIRHTVASWLTIWGFSERLVAEVLEHSRQTITAGYAHLADSSLERVISTLVTIEKEGFDSVNDSESEKSKLSASR